MPNHPNRNWRSRMHAACAQALEKWRWPDSGAGILTSEQLRDFGAQMYRLGYEAGRASTRPAKPPEVGQGDKK